MGDHDARRDRQLSWALPTRTLPTRRWPNADSVPAMIYAAMKKGCKVGDRSAHGFVRLPGHIKASM